MEEDFISKTNTTLLGKERHDDFNVAGFGLGAKVGLNLTFSNTFSFQTELKGGYIEMNNIRTTQDTADSMNKILVLTKNPYYRRIFRI